MRKGPRLIPASATIAHYRIEEMIGAGGMGDVYRARDLRLGRSVALKVLPGDLHHSPERIRRFLQEAKAASSLNHPHILTVYDAGEAAVSGHGANGTVHYMATELISGKTLRELIHQDRVPLRRLVAFLAQAADGLAKAHSEGIIHRDLKPDNIMVSGDGFAKVLDFGLAKLVESDDQRSTLADRTREGLILGSVHYMSPEQAQGLPLDHRSDIFSFGAILYEAAARQAPFQGPSAPDILHRILHEDPEPLSRIPAELDRLIMRSLIREPEERVQSMRDIALELRDISRGFDGLKLTPAVRRRRMWRSAATAVVAAAAVFGALVAGYRFRPDDRPERTIRFSIPPPPGTQFASLANSASALHFALSPDGNAIAFVAISPASEPRIWIRELDSLEARVVPGTEGAQFPFWSPDGQHLGFFAQEKLKRIAVKGGSAIVVSDAPSPRGGSWSREGVILFAIARAVAPIYRVPAGGGEATPASTLSAAQTPLGGRWPHFLPDGKRFVYLMLPDGIYTSALDSKQDRLVFPAASRAQYVEPGNLLFMRRGALYSQRVDPETLSADGSARLVQRQLGFAPILRYGAFSASADTIAFAPWINPDRRLTWLDRQGNPLNTVFEPGDWGVTSISLRDDQAVLTRADPDSGTLGVWAIDLARGLGSRITPDDTDYNRPLLSPDGRSVVYTKLHSGASDMFLKKPGVNQEERLETGDQQLLPDDWSPDGRFIIYTARDPRSGNDLWVLPIAPRGNARPFLKTDSQESEGTVSSDGRWIAYVSDESGTEDVYVQPFPAGGDRYRVSTSGGLSPRWSHDGGELFYMTPEGQIASAAVMRSDSRFVTALPRVLFRVPGILPPGKSFRTAFAVDRNGRFLLTITPAEGPKATITVVTHWRSPRE